jgi:hypothetical protein
MSDRDTNLNGIPIELQRPVIVFEEDVVFTKQVTFEKGCIAIFNKDVFFKEIEDEN